MPGFLALRRVREEAAFPLLSFLFACHHDLLLGPIAHLLSSIQALMCKHVHVDPSTHVIGDGAILGAMRDTLLQELGLKSGTIRFISVRSPSSLLAQGD